MTTIVLQLCRPQRRELIRMGRKSGDPDTANRFTAVAKLASAARPSKSHVARELDVAVSTVVRAAQRYVAGGVESLYDQRIGNGRARKVDERLHDAVSAALHQTPQDRGWERPTWTRELLCLEIQARGFPCVSTSTMGRVLSSIGARLGSPKPIVLCPWPRGRRKRVLGEIQKLEGRATIRDRVFYVDEVDVHLNPKIGRAWMPRGVQHRVVTPGKNVKHYFAGALDMRTGTLTTVEAPRKNSLLFCQLVEALAKAHPQARRLHLIVDNFIIHSSKITQAFVAKYPKVRLHFLPPYCPDHNRIERIWQDFHANVTRNHRCATMDKLLQHARAFMRDYNRRLWRNPSLRPAIQLDA